MFRGMGLLSDLIAQVQDEEIKRVMNDVDPVAGQQPVAPAQGLGSAQGLAGAMGPVGSIRGPLGPAMQDSNMMNHASNIAAQQANAASANSGGKARPIGNAAVGRAVTPTK